MPKFKTTNREMTTEALTYAVGYADLQNLFRFENAVAYTCGIYGWNSDIYLLKGNTYISTGYRPCGYRLKDSWIYKALDRYAERITKDYSRDYDKLKLLLDNAIYLLYRILDCDYRKDSPAWKEYREKYKEEYAKLLEGVETLTGYNKETVYKH